MLLVSTLCTDATTVLTLLDNFLLLLMALLSSFLFLVLQISGGRD